MPFERNVRGDLRYGIASTDGLIRLVRMIVLGLVKAR